jgi:hypothetical protein
MDSSARSAGAAAEGTCRPLAPTGQTGDAALDGLPRAIERWCERRHRTIRAFSDFGREIAHARSPQQVIMAWLHLSRGAVERLAEDARDQILLGARFSSRAAQAPPVAVDEPAASGIGETAAGLQGFAAWTGGPGESRH